MSKLLAKKIALSALFGRWQRPCPFEEGYTILLPSPMDMPFLLRYALEGLRQIDTTHCKQILVIPDGSTDDRGDALQAVLDGFPDPRVTLIRPSWFDTLKFRNSKPPGGAQTHWLMVIAGITHARCGHAFLHDADAFFLESEGLERQYAECLARDAHVLGVTPRWDPFFKEVGYKIPGTWELMFSTRWARSRPPYMLKNGWWPTPRGKFAFDSMLQPMYLDYPSGKICVMDPPPRFVHFNGTIFSFRTYFAGTGRIDEYFRIFLLTMLGELIPPSAASRWVLPSLNDLERGLTDPSARVTYGSKMAVHQYPNFRAQLDELCDSPLFQGERADRLRSMVQPWDEHFRDQEPVSADEVSLLRSHGMG
jgi:hypothetical protein